MGHSKSLRVIGQSLEVAKIPAFEIEADGPNYVVKSELLTGTGEWVLRHALSRNDFSEGPARQSTVKRSVRFTPGDISRLDSQAQLQRHRNSPQPEAYRRLSQLLRTLGDHLDIGFTVGTDRMNASAFQICWGSDLVSVYFQFLDGQCDSRTFTVEKLRQLGSSSRLLRSSRARLDITLPRTSKSIRPRNS
jgi:hypothetical protein